MAALGAVAAAAGAIASAAAPAPHPHPKRGVASAEFLAGHPEALVKLHPAWAYDWSSAAPPAGTAIEWVPMVWGVGSVSAASIRSLSADRADGRARYLLGFNEPDSSSQSNMTPAQAAALWPELESTGLRLGSPAPAVPGDGWLAQFMSLAHARHLRVDFIALHFYQDFTAPHAVADLRAQLTSIHARYGEPIWVTEIGTLDLRAWGEHMAATPTAALAHAYMRKVIAMLDDLRFVQRYAWFTDYCSSQPGCAAYSSLLTRNGHATAAGRIFAAP